MEILMARSTAKRPVIVLLSAGLIGMLAACGPGIGNAISVDKFDDKADSVSNEYIINIGDSLSIQVWEQPLLSGTMPVRSDGRISIPLINEVQAAGKTPSKLQAEIEASLKSVVLNPKVTIVVLNSKPPTISIMGEVGKPGPMPLDRDTGVAEALAAAGGLSPFAHKDRIFVVRSTPEPARIHFTYEALTRKVGKASQFRLRPGDIIVVE
jgi:polysaccharide biosynthesis/export protein